VASALAGYADPIVWLVLAAFFIFAPMVKTGLGRRIALIFIRAIGHHSLGLAYALIQPRCFWNNDPVYRCARGGLSSRLPRACQKLMNRGRPTARRWVPSDGGAVSGGVIVCAMFLTVRRQRLIAKFACKTTGIELTYTRWALARWCLALISLAVIPQCFTESFSGNQTHASSREFARAELQAHG